MKLEDIQNRKDILTLVKTFYQNVRKDEMLAPVFFQFIEDWDSHIEKIASFWELTLFSTGSYRGNPMTTHLAVDKGVSHSLTQSHFDRWLKLWRSTIELMFKGEKAELAKQRAEKIANIMFIRLYQARVG